VDEDLAETGVGNAGSGGDRRRAGVFREQGASGPRSDREEDRKETEPGRSGGDYTVLLRQGKPVWVRAGYALPYYPYAGGAVQFTKPQGDLPGAEKLQIAKLVKASAPAKLDDRVPHGTKQYFAVFTVAGPDAIPGTFAAPIGDADGDKEQVLTDLLFYYEDPKTIYDNWPQPVWDAIQKHTPTLGMSENQARMAAGILIESDSTTQGDRTVTYHSGSKTWTVTFAKGVATSVTAGG
jgi:hypothetical protein